MSYSIQLYAIDTAKLTQALGEGSPNLMASIRENLREQFVEVRGEEDLPSGATGVSPVAPDAVDLSKAMSRGSMLAMVVNVNLKRKRSEIKVGAQLYDPPEGKGMVN